MEGIIHIRIDDRLIHGQVATQWTNDLGATRIMAINDEVATNPTLKTVLRMAAPPNVSTSIITRETAVKNIKAGKYAGQKVFFTDHCSIYSLCSIRNFKINPAEN